MKKLDLATNVFLWILLILTSCKKEENNTLNISTLGTITTIEYTLTPISGGAPIVLRYRDLDGDEGKASIISGGVLKANQLYIGKLELLEESKSNTKNVLEDVLVEAQHYQIFFKSTIPEVDFSYEPQDTGDNPLGIPTILSTGIEGSGILTVALLEEPNKLSSSGLVGDIKTVGSVTNKEISFPVIVH